MNQKSVATRTLSATPIVAGSLFCIGAASFPQSSLAFSAASDALSHSFNARKIIGAGAIAATVATAACGFGGAILNNNRAGQSELVRVKASSSVTDATSSTADNKKIPITILAGFLGAGKTTALKRLLENTEGIKVGTIVNDVASVNIDAKLISNPLNGGSSGRDGGVSKNNSPAVGKGKTVELQNGCACCSLSDELLTSVSDLMEGRKLDAIVIELSGVADPMAVEQNWADAIRVMDFSTLLYYECEVCRIHIVSNL